MSHSFQSLLQDRTRFLSAQPITAEHFLEDPLYCFKFQTTEAAAEREIQDRLSEVAVYKITYRSGLAGPALGAPSDLVIHGFVAFPRSFSGSLPLVLVNRGGNNMKEHVTQCPKPPHRIGRFSDADAVYILGRLASWGYCAAASQYRGCHDLSQIDEFGGNDLHDIVNLRALFEGCPEINLKRTGSLGFSRGAMMSFLLAAQYDWLKSIVSIGGACDQEPHSKSPRHLVDRFPEDLAVQLIHAKGDAKVDFAVNFELMLAALRQRGLNVKASPFDSSQHYVLDQEKLVAELIKDWFAETL